MKIISKFPFFVVIFYKKSRNGDEVNSIKVFVIHTTITPYLEIKKKITRYLKNTVELFAT
jgi:hypothetical protein